MLNVEESFDFGTLEFALKGGINNTEELTPLGDHGSTSTTSSEEKSLNITTSLSTCSFLIYKWFSVMTPKKFSKMTKPCSNARGLKIPQTV